jgi:hypothetical protein
MFACLLKSQVAHKTKKKQDKTPKQKKKGKKQKKKKKPFFLSWSLEN